ncbi:MAG: hypothetical protein CMM00_15140 [Rhodopirellula sp.]|nr:hypothetical protein [Rhodopirellula sp.]
MEQKMVYAGAGSTSFEQARKDLLHLANLDIKTERVRRATTRNGKARLALTRLLEQAFLEKPIPEQLRGGPADQEAPPIAAVMCDGGRYQRFDRGEAKPESGSFWRESRVACLLSMTAASYGNDPGSDLPDFLKDVSIAKKLAEIGQVQGENPVAQKQTDQDQDSPWERGEMLSKEVVASSRNWKEFGSQVASQAWYRGFGKATHKVFVSDGSSAIEELQAAWFSDYTSVLDIMHALSYSLAAARAIHSDRDTAWQCYQQFATWIWRGEVDQVIASLAEHQQQLGEPPADASESDPREIVRRSRVYYSNHRSRMNYPLYREKGYPLTSSIMESTVKQVSRRVKGTEKFWSSEGGEAVLQLRGDYLSTSDPMVAHWKRAIAAANGFRTYRLSA